jgi:hypothetical protein
LINHQEQFYIEVSPACLPALVTVSLNNFGQLILDHSTPSLQVSDNGFALVDFKFQGGGN